MAGQIDFSLLTTPNFLGDALKYQAAGRQQRDDEAIRRARAAGDITTLRTLAPDEAVSLEKSQREGADRAARVTGAQAYAKGDYQEARNAYADIGDVGAVGTVDEAHDAQTKKIAGEAQYLKWVLKQGGPDAVLAQFDQRASGYGGSPEEVAGIRAKIAANPQGALDALAGAPSYKYQRAADGSIIGVDEATGETKEIYKGTRPAPSGYKYGEDGQLQFIPGGPADPTVIGTKAGVQRQAIVDRPTKKSGGKAAGASIPPPPGGWKKVGG